MILGTNRERSYRKIAKRINIGSNKCRKYEKLNE